MKIGIIGPTKVDAYCSLKNYTKDAYLQYIRFVAEGLSSSPHEFFVVPDRESCAEHFGQFYRAAGGKNLNVCIPLEDKEFGRDWLNVQIGNHIVDTKTWRNTPEEFDRICDVLICFGLGVGTMIEICYTKWYNVNRIYLLKEFVPKLPVELTHKLHITYVGTQEVVQLLSAPGQLVR